MAAPMIEQFPKGKLNNCWHYIELCKFVHPELTETIDRLREVEFLPFVSDVPARASALADGVRPPRLDLSLKIANDSCSW